MAIVNVTGAWSGHGLESLSNTWRENAGGGYWVGYEEQPNGVNIPRYRIFRYSFTVPSTNGGLNVVGTNKITVNFGSGSYGFYPENTNPSLKVFCSSKSSLGLADLANGTKLTSINNNGFSVTLQENLTPGTYYIYVHSYPRNGTFEGRYWPNKNISVSLDIQTYTNCTAPSTVSLGRQIIVPLQANSITVSWGGASGGTSNQITGYEIYGSWDRWPLSSEILTTTGNVSSCSITLTPDQGYRGKHFYISIKTIGTAAGFDSELKQIGSVKVNQLPKTQSNKTEKFLSTGGAVVITSTSDPDGHSLKYYYSTSKNGSKTAIASQRFNVTAAGTYYIWAYDGYEYSNYQNITVSLNSKPTIGAISQDKDTFITAKGQTSTYSISPILKTSASKAGKFSIVLRCAGSSNLATWGPYSVSAGSELTFKPGDIQRYIKEKYNNEDLNCTFYFNFVDNEMQESAIGKSYTIIIPGAPNIKKKPDSCYNTDEVTFNLDDSLTKYELLAKVGSTNALKNYELTDNILTFHLKESIASGKTVNFTLKGTNSYLTKTTSFSITAKLMPHVDMPLKINSGERLVIHPFDSETQKNTFSGVVSNLFPLDYEKYGVTKIELKLKYNGKEKSAEITKNAASTAEAFSFDVVYSNVFGDDDFGKDNLGLKTDGKGWRGEHAIDASLLVINKDESEFYTESVPIYINFNEKIKELRLYDAIKVDEKIYSALDAKSGNFLLQEDMNYRCDIQFKHYTYEKITVRHSYSVNGENGNYFLHGKLVRCKRDELSPGKNATTCDLSTCYGEFAIINQEIKEKIVYWRIEIFGEDGRSIFDKTYHFTGIPHKPLQGVKITEGYVENNQLDFKYEYDEATETGEIDKITAIINGKDFAVSKTTSGYSVALGDYSISGFIPLQIRVTTKSIQTLPNIDKWKIASPSKISYSPIFNVFPDAPTVAYRKHCLGINTMSPESQNKGEAVLVISPTSDRNKIIINSPSGDNFTIEGNGQVCLVNIIIDGGTWDQ